MREWYVLTYVFGAMFIAGQVYEYAHLVQEGVRSRPTPTARSSTSTTGFHGMHVTGGLIAFLLIIGRTFTTRHYSPRAGHRRGRHVVLLALRRRRVDRAVRMIYLLK